MGFWSPHSLCQDARRHGVVVHSPDLNASNALATLEPCPESVGGVAVRLGIGSVRGIGADLAQRIEVLRKDCRAVTSGCESEVLTQTGADTPYTSLEDLVRRVPELTLPQLEAMATAGVFEHSLGLGRREALWAVGAAVQSRPGRLPGIVVGEQSPTLPGMEPMEVAVADLWATGVAPNGHPTQFLRTQLEQQGVVTAAGLWDCEPRSKVLVAGIVTHRQRPMTAQGVTFMNLEDETGLINIVVSKGCWARHRKVARGAPALLIRGRLERSEGVINISAEQLTPLPVAAHRPSRDFR